VPTKRAMARNEAAELIDVASRLAPFFGLPVADLVAARDDELTREDET
jgi:hypothetical protein